MTRLTLLLGAALLVPAAAAQKAVFVAPDGSVLGAGTIDSPVGSIATALTRVAPGDTIYVRGGAYASSAPIRLDKSGEEGARIHIWAYPADEEPPVFDFTGASKGFDVRGAYLHLKGLVAENSNDNGVHITGSGAHHNVVEQMTARYNGDSGIQMDKEAAYNLLLNNDSYENYDPGNNGENADGFAVKFGVGPGNVLRGNRAWANSDDGYDFWSLDDPGQEGVLIEGNWAFRNGFDLWNTSGFQGDSNGFKLGKGNGAHTLVRNVAWDHRAHGFDVNGNASGVTVYNNTAYLNRGVNFNFDDDPAIDEQAPYVLRNNVSVAASVRMDASVVDEAFNSWSRSVNIATTADFVTLDDTGADGPRQADGSLPDLDFLRLAAGSDLIDAGTDVGLPYEGSAPDLGAYERAASGTDTEAGPGAGLALRLLGPNPARRTVRLGVDLAAPADVRLDVVDALGRRVWHAERDAAPGETRLGVDAGAWAPGLYVVRVRAGTEVASATVVRQ